jgi:type I restriction enzyme S subunit
MVKWEHKRVGEVLQLQYGKPLDEADRKLHGLYPAYGANGEKARTDKYHCDQRSIIVGRKGSAGELTLTDERFWPLDVTYFVTFDSERHDLRFLYYLLQTLDLPSLAKGVKPGLNRNEVYDLSVDVPPLALQRYIVEILDKAFQAIAVAKNNAEKSLAHIETLFDSYASALFFKSLGHWTQTTLGQVCDLYQGLAINAVTKHLLVRHSTKPLLRIKDLRNGTVEQYVDDVKYPRSSFVANEDIIYTRTGQVGLVFTGRTGVLHNNCFKVVPREDLLPEYLFWFLQNHSFRSRIQELAAKAAQPDISHVVFKQQPINLPPLDDQRSIIIKLTAMSAEIEALQAVTKTKITLLDELRRSVLHAALSGELTFAKVIAA